MLLSATLAVALAVQAGAERPLVPEAFTLEPVAQAAIDAAWLTDEERSSLRVFHGVVLSLDVEVNDVRLPAMLDLGTASLLANADRQPV